MDKEKRKFTEGIDYYLEEGRVHFTKEYLEKRGPCCGGQCRHCPYDERIKGNTILRDERID
jgi:hypothetical protein